jgi:hypothetical protein
LNRSFRRPPALVGGVTQGFDPVEPGSGRDLFQIPRYRREPGVGLADPPGQDREGFIFESRLVAVAGVFAGRLLGALPEASRFHSSLAFPHVPVDFPVLAKPRGRRLTPG